MMLRDFTGSSASPLDDGDVSGAVELIRSASLSDLCDEAFLREEFLLTIGLNLEMVHEFPTELLPWCGKGVRSWQYPIQFSKYLTFLSKQKIRSYLEIGCRFGGTFIIVVEYLRRFSDLYNACALDIEETSIMREYSNITSGVEYKIGNSLSRDMQSFLGSASWDLAFIDGDHTFEGCSTDYRSVYKNSKLIVLHDIVNDACPGVGMTWDKIKSVVPSSRLFEATDQYKEVKTRTGTNFLGIGVVDFR